MSEPYVGEIKMGGWNFAPRNYAFCDGQLLAISQNDALFSLLGTIYGGDGRTTFALPDLRGRLPMHVGSGPGLTPRTLGQEPGSEAVALTAAQLPAHSHALQGVDAAAGTQAPAGGLLAAPAGRLYATQAPDVAMGTGAIGSSGASQAHSNLMPANGITFVIALVGIYPSRS